MEMPAFRGGAAIRLRADRPFALSGAGARARHPWRRAGSPRCCNRTRIADRCRHRIGRGAKVGEGCHIGYHAVLGTGVVVGDGCRIGAYTVISNALIGRRVDIASCVGIGGQGFGFVPGPTGPLRMLQLGRVIIEDDVEIGANCAIDRGATGAARSAAIPPCRRVSGIVRPPACCACSAARAANRPWRVLPAAEVREIR